MKNDKKKILLVEDEIIIAQAEALLLKKGGYEVATVMSGEEAIEKIRSGGNFDLILMDIDLGKGMDGTSAAETILKDHDIPVLFLSSHTEPEFLERTDKITSYGHVVKNSSQTVLFTSIKMAFRLHEARMKLVAREQMLEKSLKEQKAAEDSRRKTTEQLERINKVFVGLGPDYSTNINSLTALCGELLNASAALYNRLSDKSLYAEGYWNTPGNFNPMTDPDGHICYDVIRNTGKNPLIVTNLQASSYAESDPNVRALGLKTYMGHAVQFEGRNMGSLCVVYQNDYVPDDDDVRIMGIVASAIGNEETREQARLKIQENETRYRLLADNSSDVIWTMDFDGRITYISPSVFNMTGYTSDEAISRKFEDYILPEYIPVIRKYIARELALPREKRFISRIFEYKQFCKDKSVIDIETTVTWLFDKKGEPVGLQGSNRCVNERKRNEEALAQSETFNRKLVESLPVGILVLDSDRVISYENDELKKILGVPEGVTSKALGMKMTDLKPLADTGILSVISGIFEGQSIVGSEFRYRSLYGKETDLEINAAPIMNADGLFISGIIMVTDISSRKRAEAQIEKHSSKMEFLSRTAMGFIDLSPGENIFDFIAGCLKELLPDYRIVVTEYNEAEDLTTIRAMENFGNIINQGIKLLGKDFIGLKLPIKAESKKDLISQKVMIGPKGIYDITNGVIPKPIAGLLDRLVDFGTIYGMGFARQDNLYGNVVIFSPRGKSMEDVSIIEAFIKQASVALQKRRAEEGLARSVEEKAALLRELQHRVKNSLAIIAGLIELEADRFDDEEVQNLLVNIRGRVSSMAVLYDLLYHSGDVKEIRLNHYLSEMSNILVASYSAEKEQIKLQMELDEIIIDVKRALALGLIVNELLTNSLKYAFPGKRKGTIRIILEKRKDRALITVADNGTGLPPHVRPGKSTGVGMELVKMLLSQLNGDMKYKYEKGAQFQIKIPL